MSEKLSGPQRARKLFVVVHRWIGLILGLWLVLVAVTGSLMAWRGEIGGMELAMRYPIRKPSADAPMIPLSQAVAAVKKAYPLLTERDLAQVTVPNRNMPFYMFAQGRGAKRLTFPVDPYTGTVHRPVNPRSMFMGTVNQLHTRLLSGFRGYVANGTLAIFGVLLLISGIYVWWPTGAATFPQRLTVKRGHSLNRTFYDLHNVLGVYLFPVLLIVAVTAPIMVGEHLIREGADGFRRNWATNGAQAAGGERRRPGAESGARGEGGPRGEGRQAARRGERAGAQEGAAARGGERSRAQGGMAARGGGGRGDAPQGPKVEPAGSRLSDDALLEIGRNSAAGEVTRVRRPIEPDQAFQVTYVRPYGISRNGSVFVDPYRGTVLTGGQAEAPRRQSAFMLWAHQLHFGEFGGVASKVIYTIAGLLPLGLFITGLTLWARKKISRSRKAAGANAEPRGGRLVDVSATAMASESSGQS
ncbi:MAG: PepSY-associated TM helix domain-containing protein [Actinomycetota bacterium]